MSNQFGLICLEIPTDELEKLTAVLETMGNDVTLLRKWYRKDNNKVSQSR
jgi:hypothetical protein